jgi:hydroxymethylbilane synthase
MSSRDGAPLRLATRSSPQATAQANAIRAQLVEAGIAAELVFVDTEGDRTQAAQVPLHSIGGLGVFTREIQTAVVDGRADAAVHSAKDLPTDTHPALCIAAIGARRDARDALIGARRNTLADGATVATGSVRRRAQLHEVRPDLHFVELRGNIGTRLDRIPAGGAIVMAVAALQILELSDRIDEVLDPEYFVPAVGQGAVAVECRVDDHATRDALATVNDPATYDAVSVERAWLGELGSGCSSPVGAHVVDGTLWAFLAGDTGVQRRQIDLVGDPRVDRAAAATLASAMRDAAMVR